MTPTNVKTRFAPSPTGRMHLGNLRTALFNALLARSRGGRFLLRLEDTDESRSSGAHAQTLMADLRWMGLHWDEGPEAGGEAGPYHQSERGAVYERYYRALEAADQAYPCFCTERELELSRKAQRAAGKPPRYAGTCAHLTAEERERRRAEGRRPTLRFRVPAEETVVFHDLVRGEQRFPTDEIGDFIIRRADGTAAFFFCNAVDDALMGVSHVLRGEDHLTNTPRQLLLLRALDLPQPEYGHINLITGDDGAPLSKRNGSLSVAELREAGWLPEAVLNYLARLGHHYTGEVESQLLDLQGLADAFRTDALGRAPARFDRHQLSHWQQLAVHRADEATLAPWLERLDDAVPADRRRALLAAVRDNILFPDDLAAWGQRVFGPLPALAPDTEAVIRDAGPAFYEAALAELETTAGDFPALAKAVRKATGAKGRQLFMPLRAALTGLCRGPELGPVYALMPVDIARCRLEQARELAATTP
ncbi:glutamate--tRNA ligase [Alkalilimnicola ehrlichii MLHE-1]|uniref:Glutamate--tRNA ligase 2 n=1 Tax=Alkalilimnicola ehrlichii (strain ATCC BAA-1101 / DSM 17681 / MLHE-1) TaxID=187272 RepID=SYE2_ALKEH|nr:glutamate--tRNA ligase [Alkalilimnicola ehrlichii]Q0A7N2.1 RecName: Full=Glutamate--tRNA ligase 2; AltName: Full=Glutamyl-tRNA synthetase 2; Short=GluRS 2 [Alkalilimnicola ehrlichii MLHE-1]ABI57155.1 glutamate--tRNA(Gln) ligase / glutamyl-tRNA synthetase [Alkalilimnicola ehrlichii MLHE-1]